MELETLKIRIEEPEYPTTYLGPPIEDYLLNLSK